jgi:hypothetical protein
MKTTVTKVRVTDLIRILVQMLQKQQYFADIEACNTEDKPNNLLVFPSLPFPDSGNDDTPLDDSTIAQLM